MKKVFNLLKTLASACLRLFIRISKKIITLLWSGFKAILKKIELGKLGILPYLLIIALVFIYFAIKFVAWIWLKLGSYASSSWLWIILIILAVAFLAWKFFPVIKSSGNNASTARTSKSLWFYVVAGSRTVLLVILAIIAIPVVIWAYKVYFAPFEFNGEMFTGEKHYAAKQQIMPPVTAASFVADPYPGYATIGYGPHVLKARVPYKYLVDMTIPNGMNRDFFFPREDRRSIIPEIIRNEGLGQPDANGKQWAVIELDKTESVNVTYYDPH